MILALGLGALVAYGFSLGTIWPAAPQQGQCLAWAGTIAKSLWLSWLVVVVALVCRTEDPLPWCLLLILAVWLWRWRRPPVPLQALLPRGMPQRLLAGLVLAAGSGFTYSALSRLFTSEGLFTEWDAVVSWNRWAVELASNTYQPVSAAYPIFFPGLWSLIYRAQDTAAVWFVAKTSLLLVPLLCVLLLAALVEQGLVASALFAATGFIVMMASFGGAVFSGYMDAPVALLMLASGLWMVLAVTLPNTQATSPSLLPLSALVGITAITKQAGMLMLLPYVLVLLGAMRQQQLAWRAVLLQLGVSVVPTLLFLGIYLTRESNPIGNLELLQGFAATSAGSQSLLLHAFAVLFGGWRWLLLALLLGLAFLNLLHQRRASAQLGTSMLLLAIAGFPLFATCCSYDARNGWWLWSLLLLAAVCAVAGFDASRLQRWQPHVVAPFPPAFRIGLVAMAAGALLTVAVLLPDQRTLALQQRLQWKVGVPSVSALLQRHHLLLAPGGSRLITTYMPARWLPELDEAYVWCQNRRANVELCVREAAAHHPSLILRRVGDYGFLNSVLLDQRLLGQVDGFQLYGPFQPAELDRLP